MLIGYLFFKQRVLFAIKHNPLGELSEIYLYRGGINYEF